MVDVLSQQKPKASTVVTTPSTQAFGDAASIGTDEDYARAGHKHGMMSNPLPANAAGVLANTGSGVLWVPAYYKNAVANGDFSVAQLGTSNLDRWTTFAIGTGVIGAGTQQSSAGTVITPAGSPTAFEFATYANWGVTTADTSMAAGDLYGIQQKILGYDARDVGVNGGALTFACYTTKSGTYCLTLLNRAASRAYVREFTMPANAWTYVATTFPACPLLTGDMRTNIGLYLQICLASGSNWQTTPNTWQSSNYAATSNQVNFMDSTSNVFYLAFVNLVPGSVPMPYQFVDYNTQLQRCMYYRQVFLNGSTDFMFGGQNVGTTSGYIGRNLIPVMGGTPSLGISSPSHFAVWNSGATNVNLSTFSGTTCSPRHASAQYTVASGLVAGDVTWLATISGSAQFYADWNPG